jgi:HAD superfamily hydrolase (TIGR01509 family)
VRALVFDYDGLIIDTETPEFECWQRVYAEHGHELKIETWVQVVGTVDTMDPAGQLDKLVGRALDWPLLHERRLQHHKELIQAKGLLPGVESLMRRARAAGWKVGVASSSSSAWVEGGLERLGLMPYVQAVRTRDRVKNLKPHPEPYLSVLADLGAQAAGSFAFEDSRPGVSAAKAAGLTVVAVPNALTRLHDLSHADMVLESLEAFDLPGGE